jgi:excisionase family DNA binding protein
MESCWLTVAEAADYLKTKPRTLLKWVREGTIRGYPLHGIKRRIWRFRREDLDAALGFNAAAVDNSALSSVSSSVVRVQ